MEGWLWKKSPAGFTGLKSWQKRWCILNETSLSYYKKRGQSANLGIIPIGEVACVTYLPMKRGGSRFDVQVKSHRTYAFYASSRLEAREWVMAINTLRPNGRDREDGGRTSHANQPCFNVTIFKVRGVPIQNKLKAFVNIETPPTGSDERGAPVSILTKSTGTMDDAKDAWNVCFDLHNDGKIAVTPNWPSLTVVIELTGSNQCLGFVEICVGNITEGTNKEVWYGLRQRKGQPEGDVSGQILVGIHFETGAYVARKHLFQFGRKLSDVRTTKIDGYSSPIPGVLLEMKDYLFHNNGNDLEGVFRIAPDENEFELVKAQLNENTFVDCKDVHCMAHLIKVFFRDLPSEDKILSDVDIKKMAACEDEAAAADILNNQIKEPKKSILEWLLDMAVQVWENGKVNKMSAQALSIVIGPNLKDCDDPLSLTFNQQVARFFQWAMEHRKAVVHKMRDQLRVLDETEDKQEAKRIRLSMRIPNSKTGKRSPGLLSIGTLARLDELRAAEESEEDEDNDNNNYNNKTDDGKTHPASIPETIPEASTIDANDTDSDNNNVDDNDNDDDGDDTEDAFAKVEKEAVSDPASAEAWQELISDEGKTYYWNKVSDETAWELPKGVQPLRVRASVQAKTTGLLADIKSKRIDSALDKLLIALHTAHSCEAVSKEQRDKIHEILKVSHEQIQAASKHYKVAGDRRRSRLVDEKKAKARAKQGNGANNNRGDGEAEWEEKMSRSQGKIYYWNRRTGRTSWSPPSNSSKIIKLAKLVTEAKNQSSNESLQVP